MVPYKNTAENSGVKAYEIGTDRIAVQFADGRVYIYTNHSAGPGNISQMKQLAKAGKGLSTFISQVVKNHYEEKSA